MTKREVILVILFSIITCGIYSIYWMYVTANELNECDKQEPLRNYIVAILLSIVTCGIYGIYWMYKFYKKVDIVTQKDNFLLNFLLSLLVTPLISMAIVQDSINKLEG